MNAASAGLSLPTAVVFDISDIAQFFEHGKSSSVSQLSKDKPRDLQKLLKYFRGTLTVLSGIII